MGQRRSERDYCSERECMQRRSIFLLLMLILIDVDRSEYYGRVVQTSEHYLDNRLFLAAQHSSPSLLLRRPLRQQRTPPPFHHDINSILRRFRQILCP